VENQGHEYTINITAESLREFLEAMKAEGQFSDLFDTGIERALFWAKQDKAGDRPLQMTRIYIKPQESSVRIKVTNEFPGEESYSAPPLAWDRIRFDLNKSGYRITRVDGFAITAVFEHSYIDPASIQNANHRKVVRALIEAELSPDRIKQTDIASRFNYSPGRISEIKALYTREEFKRKVPN
jgi:hypothetical protein